MIVGVVHCAQGLQLSVTYAEMYTYIYNKYSHRQITFLACFQLFTVSLCRDFYPQCFINYDSRLHCKNTSNTLLDRTELNKSLQDFHNYAFPSQQATEVPLLY